jgi:hypothetical protein
MTAYFLVEVLSRALHAGKLNSAVLEAVMNGMRGLLVTEGHRRHLGELRKSNP